MTAETKDRNYPLVGESYWNAHDNAVVIVKAVHKVHGSDVTAVVYMHLHENEVVKCIKLTTWLWKYKGKPLFEYIPQSVYDFVQREALRDGLRCLSEKSQMAFQTVLRLWGLAGALDPWRIDLWIQKIEERKHTSEALFLLEVLQELDQLKKELPVNFDVSGDMRLACTVITDLQSLLDRSVLNKGCKYYVKTLDGLLQVYDHEAQAACDVMEEYAEALDYSEGTWHEGTEGVEHGVLVPFSKIASNDTSSEKDPDDVLTKRYSLKFLDLRDEVLSITNPEEKEEPNDK